MELPLPQLLPETVWGVFTRLVGLVYLIAIGSLYHQVLPIAGSRGVSPVALLLDRIRRDFPLHQRILHFPSLLWISSSDWFLRALIVIGSCAAVVVVLGGPLSRWGLLICWLVYLSLDVAVELTYPWDCVLFEAGFLALFLEPLQPLPSLSASAAPLPIVALAFNLLLMRVILGFGKYKFVGIMRMDLGYLKPFLINQPIPTALGWYAYHLPTVFHRLGLLLLFLIELPLPLLIFFSGPARILAGVGISLLMLAIQLTGNFGFFNLILVVLCVPLLDSQSPLFRLSLEQATSSWMAALVHVILGVILLGSLLYFPFNSWCTRAWLEWPALANVRRRPLRALLAFYREIAALRLAHAYGVFGSQSAPGLKFIPVIEGSVDGHTWHEYEYRFMPCTERSPPRAFAPYQPRWDHFILYEGCGVNPAEFLSSTLGGSYNPYLFSRYPPLARAMQRLTEADSPVRDLFGSDPFHGRERPRMLRARLYALQPTSPAEQRQTGRWWTRHLVGTHLPTFEPSPDVFAHWLSGPELFHWDAIFWRRRATALARYVRAARSADSLAIIEDAAVGVLGIPAMTVDRFWSEFVPMVQPPSTGDWRGLSATVAAVRCRFCTETLVDFERLGAMLAIALAARLEQTSDNHPGQLPLPSNFHLGMLAYRLMLRGRTVFEAALSDLELVRCEARRLEPAAGAWLWAIFRFETMMFHARSFRLTLKFSSIPWQPILPGFLLLIPFLAGQAGDDAWQRPIEISRSVRNGDWLVNFPDHAAPIDRAVP